ncbi:MAG: ABC transporter permease [Opitutaceae bacterium]
MNTPQPLAPPSDSSAFRISRAWSGLTSDLRFAVRMLIKHQGLTATALVTLALCIGANTAIFSMLYALVIKPLPYQEPERIVEVYNSFAKVGLSKSPSNVVQYLDFKEHADAFAQLALWQQGEFTFGAEGQPVRIAGVVATAGIFEVLGIQPLLGRFLTDANHIPDAGKVVVLTESFWDNQYQRDPAILGKTLRLDGETFEIIGVAPHDLEAFDARARFVRPMTWPPDRVAQFSRYGVSPRLYGRLKPDATIAQAQTQVAGLEQQYYDAAPPGTKEFLDRSGHVIGVDTVQSQRVEPVKTKLYLLQGCVLCVLLIGCLNVANLLLARSNARHGELAIRAALGAGRGVIARQLLIESTLLTWLGAALGVAFAWASLQASNRFITQLLPTALPFELDARVLGYTALVTIVMSAAIGVLPVIHVLGGNLLGAIQTQSRSASTGRGVRTMSSVLVVVQVAFALILLVGAGLLIRGFAKATAVDPGFDPREVVVARVALPAKYRRPPGNLEFQQRLLTMLQEIPGTTSSLSTGTPFETGLPINAFQLRDYSLPPGAAQPGAFRVGASPAYLETLRIPLREGRWFNASDTNTSRPVYVVDQEFAERYFSGRSAVGQHLTFGGPPPKEEDWPEIIGVVGNVRHNGVEEKSGNPFLYQPLEQTPAGELSVLVRSSRAVPELLALVRAKIAAIDPALPVFKAGAMNTVISTRLNNRRAIMLLLASFAGIALLLSAIGIYGVLAYDVSQRTREIGIRGAIGATKEQVVSMILKQGLWKTGIGLVFGLLVALACSRFMTSFLFEVKPTDPIAYVAVTSILLVVAILASYLPARRAARIDPIIALRSE